MTRNGNTPQAERGIGRELKRGALDLIVLHTLGLGEAYGYEIVSKILAKTDGIFVVTDGTIYPVLYRLENAGFVGVRWETPERGVPRKYYKLTPKGREEWAALKEEWSLFAGAMQQLLQESEENNETRR